MNTREENNIQSNTYLINSIKNLRNQLNEIKEHYSKDDLVDLEFNNNTQSVENIKNSITKIVGNIDEKKKVEESSVYKAIQDVKDNDTLIISEKTEKVYLPYTVQELNEYLNEYPDEYKSLSDVINQEYVVSLSKFKNPMTARLKETYYLMRDIEMKSIIESFRKAVEFMFNSKLNPAIISACKSEEQLNNYRYCAERSSLDEFTDFEIVFEFTPLDNNKYKHDFEELFLNTKKRKNRGKHY